MKLEKKQVPDTANEGVTIDVIVPLETVEYGRRVNFNACAVPSEQGELLLEFLRRHLLSTGPQY